MSSIMQNLNPAERVQHLKTQAYAMPNKTFTRELEPAEIQAETNAYVEDQMRIAALEDELAQKKAEISGKVNAIKKRNETRLTTIASRSRQVNEIVYGIRDLDAAEMNFYDKFGRLVENRGLMPEEYQGKMFVEKNGNVEQEFPFGEGEGEGEGNPDELDDEAEYENDATMTGTLEELEEQVEEEGEDNDPSNHDALAGSADDMEAETMQEEHEQFGDHTPDWQQAEERADEQRKEDVRKKRKKR